MKYSLEDLETIIFDLGEVIVNLDSNAVINEFARLLNLDFVDLKSILVGSKELFQYETGIISKEMFIQGINEKLNADISVNDFEHAWNLMIGEIPNERLSLMEQLRQTHQVLILSNTNRMHELCFDAKVRTQTGKLMSDFVDKAYYSHIIGYRKPNLDIYEFIIADSQLNPHKALFLDDKLENVLSAREVGLRSEQIKNPNDIFQILADAK